MFEHIFPHLACPKCKGNIHPSIITIYDASCFLPSTKIIFGIASCKCSEYPIVQGIFYLLERNRKRAVYLIKNHKFSKSVDCLLDFPKGLSKLIKWLKPWGRIDRNLARVRLGTTGLFLNNSWILRLMELYPNSRPWAKYLRKRTKSPTFANTLASLSFFKKGLSVDIASGIGHFLPFLETVAGQGYVTAVDNSFWNLYLSSLAHPSVSHILSDAQNGLPFKKDNVSNISLNDCFHCFSKRKKLANEIERILTKDGVVSATHVHNFAKGNNFVGYPIKFKHFKRLFKKFHLLALPEKYLHQKIVLEGKTFKIDKMKPLDSLFEKELENTYSYVAYLFKKRPDKISIRLKKSFFKKAIKISDLDYSEDPWLLED